MCYNENPPGSKKRYLKTRVFIEKKNNAQGMSTLSCTEMHNKKEN